MAAKVAITTAAERGGRAEVTSELSAGRCGEKSGSPTQKLEKATLLLDGGNLDGSCMRAAWQVKKRTEPARAPSASQRE